jgi:hypothetical protein
MGQEKGENSAMSYLCVKGIAPGVVRSPGFSHQSMPFVSLATPGTEACDAVGSALRPEWREWPGPEFFGESRLNGTLANAAQGAGSSER